LTVWKFHDASGAGAALEQLERLEKEGAIDYCDTALVTWPDDARKPHTDPLHAGAVAGALGRSFWGFLFGLIFFVPLLGTALGAGTGDLTGSLAEVGMDDDFIKRIRSEVIAGTSALFVLTATAVITTMREAFASQHPRLIFANLSDEQDRVLRSAFAEV
jgi:uncharacterized membrane protein